MEKSGFQKIFGPSHSRYVPMKAGLPLPSSCCKGEACLPRLHSKMVYRGVGADFKKPKKYFRLIMKKNYLENFKPLYTNKKVQLQLDFLISPAVAGLFD